MSDTNGTKATIDHVISTLADMRAESRERQRETTDRLDDIRDRLARVETRGDAQDRQLVQHDKRIAAAEASLARGEGERTGQEQQQRHVGTWLKIAGAVAGLLGLGEAARRIGGG